MITTGEARCIAEDPRGCFAPRKLLRGGVVLEPSFHDARRLSALGIEGDEAFNARGEALAAFLPDLRKACDAIVARNPAVLD